MIDPRDEAQLLRLAEQAAAAGAAILDELCVSARGGPVSFERKASAIDLVTEADTRSEAAIVALLRASGLAIVAEEGSVIEGASGAADAVWYVDPLDGTTNYAFGHPCHCVSIGLVVGGQPRLGVVHAPALGIVWSGGVALETTRRDLLGHRERRLSVSTVEAIEDGLLATGFPYDRRTSSDDNLAAHHALMKRALGVLRCGSAAIDLALVADGTYAGYWERKLKPWDLAAGASLVRAAGGTVTDPWGRAFDAVDGNVLASNGRVHASLLTSLAPHLPIAPAR